MKAEEIIIEQQYECSSRLLKEKFIGQVQIKLDNSCIVDIIKFDEKDIDTVKELQKKIVISYKDIKKLKNNKEIA